MSLSITLNGQRVEVEKGVTILQAARQHGVDIPTLCDYPGLPSHGSCRLCVVEIQGRPSTPTACTTPVEDGMMVQTETPKLLGLRKELLQMLLAEHPASCLICPENTACQECMVTLRKAGVTTGCRSCPKDQQCELQDLVVRFGIDRIGYPIRYRMLPTEKADPFFDRDYNLCVLCGRCIRVCTELHFSSSLAYTQRGSNTLVGTAFGRSHIDAGCTFCGACVEACPTGALSEKTRKWDGKADGQIETTCPFCSIACEMRLQVKGGQVIGSLPRHNSAAEALCVKGRFSVPEVVNHPTRLTQPQKSNGRTRLPLGWDEALAAAAEKLSACQPGEFAMLVSAHSSSEDLYIAQKFTRLVMKTHAVHALDGEAYGDGLNGVRELVRRSVSLDSLDNASAILCLGVDARYAQSVVEVALHKAKRRGAKLIVLPTGKNSLGDYADLVLKPGVDGEAGLLEKLSNLTAPGSDKKHPANSPQISLVEAAQWLKAPGNSPVIVIGPTALACNDNRRLLAAVDRLAQAATARVIVLPAQGNLAGSFLVGAYPNLLPGGYPTEDLAAREFIARQWGSPLPEKTSPAFFAPDDLAGLKVLYVINEKPPAGAGEHPFTIYQSEILPPGDEPGIIDLYLPAAAFSESRMSRVDYAGRVAEYRQAVPPPGEARPSWQILCLLARAMGVAGFDFTSVEEVQAEIASLVGDFRDDSTLIPIFCETQAERARPAYPLNEQCYLGFPLAAWVEGLRSLYPEEMHG